MEYSNFSEMRETALVRKLDRLHQAARQNVWMRYFAIFLRMALALGFIPAGIVKIIGERFTDLVVNHPMGHFLDAFYQTGFYYPFVGIMQVIAGVMLLIPRTATLGAFIYFPIILNICVLSLSVRFVGSLVSSPLMVLANLYLLCWDYHKWKYILPVYPVRWRLPSRLIPPLREIPFKFFGGVLAAMIAVLILVNSFEIMPANNIDDCLSQCEDVEDPAACKQFCACIHETGDALGNCLEEYEN